ncbi:type II secretion system protein G [Clostridium sp. CAG:715]|nr:type II secretion system protein G [Clostridium sp. CAG:715]
MKKLKGFTLTELMVAMGVIGILVAVVTPAIMKTRPNKNKMMIKKSFYTAEQIVSTLINDERLYPDMKEICDRGVVEGEDPTKVYCAFGFDYDNSVRYEGETYAGNTKFADLFASRLNVKTEDETNHIYYTTDGIKWDLSDTVGAWTKGQDTPGKFGDQTNAAGIGEILVDVNGDEAPNCRESNENCSADDFDQYVIEILATGKMRIDSTDAKAVDYATINTSIKDSVN